jgi:hypothetical protein
MGEMSKLGLLVGWVKHAIWADSLYFLYLLLLSISKILAPPQPTPLPFSKASQADFYFSRIPNDGQESKKTSNSEGYTTSSGPFRIYQRLQGSVTHMKGCFPPAKLPS